jgi:Flp pilus assembly pilin Flp
MSKLLVGLWRGEEGQDLVEYGLLAALLAVALVGAILLVKDQLNTVFSSIVSSLSAAS